MPCLLFRLYFPWTLTFGTCDHTSLSLLKCFSLWPFTHISFLLFSPRNLTLLSYSFFQEPLLFFFLRIRSDQIRSVAQSCPILCDPMNRSTPGLPVHHQLPEFTETHVHRVSDAIQPSHKFTKSVCSNLFFPLYIQSINIFTLQIVSWHPYHYLILWFVSPALNFHHSHSVTYSTSHSAFESSQP